VIATLEIVCTLLDRLQQSSALLRIEVAVDRHELDLGALGQIGRLIEHESSMMHPGLERLHRVESLIFLGLSGERIPSVKLDQVLHGVERLPDGKGKQLS
jgi:hypothetical protein